MKTTRRRKITAMFPLILLLTTLHVSPTCGQEAGRMSIIVQGNTRLAPTVGIRYSAADRASLRFSVGYFQFEDTYRPPVTLGVMHFDTYQYGGALAGLYELTRQGPFSLHAGAEGQYVYAAAPMLREIEGARASADRISISGLLGASIRPLSWLSVVGEVGVGHVRGVPVRGFRADLDSTIDRWGITHVSPGIRIFL